MTRKTLLDLNALIALAEPGHDHHSLMQGWFDSVGASGWGVCPLTEAGFVRITTSPSFRPGPRTFEQALAALQTFRTHPGYTFWAMRDSWVTLTAPFVERVFGHQQVTDAYLLGLAIKEDGVLVTFDRGLRYMAGPKFSRNLLILD